MLSSPAFRCSVQAIAGLVHATAAACSLCLTVQVSPDLPQADCSSCMQGMWAAMLLTVLHRSCSEAGLSELAMQQAVARLRHLDLLPSDKAFHNAGAAAASVTLSELVLTAQQSSTRLFNSSRCRNTTCWAPQVKDHLSQRALGAGTAARQAGQPGAALIFLNRFLDISEALDEGEHAGQGGVNDFGAFTGIPRTSPLPKVPYASKAVREEVCPGCVFCWGLTA